MTEAREDRLNHLRSALKKHSADAARYRKAHVQASEDQGTRNSRLSLLALVASALTGTTAVWSALGDTLVGSGGLQGSVVLWGIAVTGIVTAVSTTLQKTGWGSAELIKISVEAEKGACF